MEFADGYPLGNGRIGVMCFGGPARSLFAINHFDLWYRPRAKAKPLPGYFARIRRHALAGEWPPVNRAMALGFDSWKATPDGSFQPGALLELWLQLRDGARDYRRTLDIRTGEATTEFRSAGYRYVIRAFTHPSLPLATMVLETGNPEGWLGRLRLFRPPDDRFHSPVARSAADELRLAMRFPDGTAFQVGARLEATGRRSKGPVQSPGETAKSSGEATLSLPGTRRLILRVAIGVTRGSRRVSLALREPMPAVPRHAIGEPFLRRVSVEIPAAQRRLFETGRYLFASSCFPGGLPPNLQGIWNERVKPPCDSDYHMDLNVQMALWHVPTGNLLEYHEPFFRLIDRMIPGARRNARLFFEMRGLAFPTCSYGRGEGHRRPDTWVGTSGWLMQHYWRHWRYTLDRQFLADRAYPLFREVSRFYLDYLVEQNGRLIIIPSESPENRLMDRSNGQYGRNSTFDLAVFREVFMHTVEAARWLRGEDALISEIGRALGLLSDYPRAKDGRIREMEDYEFQLGHRHMAHMYPLFPGDEIMPETPDLFQGARLALERFRSFPPTGMAHWLGRFGEGAWAGWTYPLLACCLARLGEGDEALGMLKRYVSAYHCEGGLGLCFEHRDLGFGQNASPEIGKWIEFDAPLGAVAALQEMLLQSHHGILRLLPAVPAAWREGSFRGFRAEDGFVIDTEWQRGRRIVATVVSACGRPCRLKVSPGYTYVVSDGRGRRVTPLKDPREGILAFPTRRDMRYHVHGRKR